MYSDVKGILLTKKVIYYTIINSLRFLDTQWEKFLISYDFNSLMGSIKARSLGEVIGECISDESFRPLSVPEARRQIANFKRRTSYYITKGKNGTRIFGLDGTKRIFWIPEYSYESVGSPEEGREISVQDILKYYKQTP